MSDTILRTWDLVVKEKKKRSGLSIHGASSVLVNTDFELVATSKKSAMKRVG